MTRHSDSGSHARPEDPAPYAAWRAREVHAAGVRVRAYEAGRTDSQAPVLVLVHGVGHWTQAAWDGLAPAFDTTHRIVAFDLPGFGASERPDAPYTLAYFSDALARVIATCVAHGTAFALVGHSLGGMIAADYASRAPERVRTLVLIDPAGFARTPRTALRVVAAIPLEGLIVRMRPPRRLVRRTLRMAVYDPRVIGGDVYARAEAYAREPAFRRAFARVYAGALDAFLHLEALHRHFATWRGPTLLVWGRDDRFIPIAALAGARRVYPHADVLELDACGHCPNVERPEDVARRMRRSGV